MVLSDTEIKTRMAAGDVVICPYSDADLGGASYDVRLGEWFYEAKLTETPALPNLAGPLYNIYGESGVRSVWDGPHIAPRGELYKLRWSMHDWSNVADDDQVIMLGPRANLLCHTQEFIGIRRLGTTMMKARSSIGRSLINVCQCAGMGDPGYINRWTMEIHNRSDYSIPLVVGRRVAQIVFLETGETERAYSSKYQGIDDLDELVRSWSPESMLPRLSWDRDVVGRVRS